MTGDADSESSIFKLLSFVRWDNDESASRHQYFAHDKRVTRSSPFRAGFDVIERCWNDPRQSRRKNGYR
jgi:hypothetical protein